MRTAASLTKNAHSKFDSNVTSNTRDNQNKGSSDLDEILNRPTNLDDMIVFGGPESIGIFGGSLHKSTIEKAQ